MSFTLAMAASMWCAANRGPVPGRASSTLQAHVHVLLLPSIRVRVWRSVLWWHAHSACHRLRARTHAANAPGRVHTPHLLVVVLQHEGRDGARGVRHAHGPSVAADLQALGCVCVCVGRGSSTRCRHGVCVSVCAACARNSSCRCSWPQTVVSPSSAGRIQPLSSARHTSVKKGSAPTWSRWKCEMNSASMTRV
jgi:hypothetical protein